MAERQVIPLVGGHNSKRDVGLVGVTQLIKSQGAEYRIGDSEIIHKIPGRSLFGTVAASSKVQGLVLATYDDATTFLLAIGATGIVYYSDASNGTTGTFTAATLPTGGTREATTNKLTAAHFQNRWFIATGKNSNLVIEADATVVNHGMYAPNQGQQTITAIGLGVIDHYLTVETSSAGGATFYAVTGPNGPNVADNFGSKPFTAAVMDDEGDNPSLTYQVTSTTSFSNRQLELQFAMGDDEKVWFGQQPQDDSQQADDDRPWAATLTISVALDGGTTFTTHVVQSYDTNLPGIETLNIAVADGTTTEDIRVKFEVKADTLEGLTNLTFKIYAVRLSDGSTVTTLTTSGSLFYACTEFDANRNWESALSGISEIPSGTVLSAVKYDLPPVTRSANATHFKIYRTSDNNAKLVESELGFVGKVKVGETSFNDTFQVFGITEIPSNPLYEFLQLDEFGVKRYYDINTPPPPMEFIGNFQGAMFGLKNRAYYQSMAGRPNQWPRLFTIDRMPFKENAALIAGQQVGDILWLGTEAGVILLDHPIETRQGSLSLPAPRKLEGAPGVTGAYAVTPLSFAGESLVAWVSNHGIYVSNLATFQRITDDLDWEATVTEASLDKAVLFWREKKEQLVMLYDSTGDGVNDSYMLIHMGDQQKAPTGRPLITLGHPGKLAHWTGGRIGGVWKEFSCASAAAGVYLEGGSLTGDASQSHDGSTDDIPFDVQTGRQYLKSSVDVGRAQMYHSATATTMTLTVNYATGRDGTENDRNADKLLVMASSRSKWTDFHVSQSGDFMQWRFQHTGQVAFSLGPVAPFVELADDQGIIE